MRSIAITKKNSSSTDMEQEKKYNRRQEMYSENFKYLRSRLTRGFETETLEFADVYKNAASRKFLTLNEEISLRKITGKLDNYFDLHIEQIGRKSKVRNQTLFKRKSNLSYSENGLENVYDPIKPAIPSQVFESSPEDSSDSIKEELAVHSSLNKLQEIVKTAIGEPKTTGDSETVVEVFDQEIPSKTSMDDTEEMADPTVEKMSDLPVDEMTDRTVEEMSDPTVISSKSKEEVEETVLKPSFVTYLGSVLKKLKERSSAPSSWKTSIDAFFKDNNSYDELEDSGLSSSNIDEYEDKKKFSYKYQGEYDLNCLRTNFGCLKWLDEDSRKYCGYFQYNSLHGDGYYFIKREGYSGFYNGKFYNNQMHGYGLVIYNNGDKFEGFCIFLFNLE